MYRFLNGVLVTAFCSMAGPTPASNRVWFGPEGRKKCPRRRNSLRGRGVMMARIGAWFERACPSTALATLIFVIGGSVGWADEIRWGSLSGGHWHHPSNWVGGVPLPTDSAAFLSHPSGTSTISLDGTTETAGLRIRGPKNLSFTGDPISFTTAEASTNPFITLQGNQVNVEISTELLFHETLYVNTENASATMSLSRPLRADNGDIVKRGLGKMVATSNSQSWSGDFVVEAGIADIKFATALGNSLGKTILASSTSEIWLDSLGDVPEPFVVHGGTIRAIETRPIETNVGAQAGYVALQGPIELTAGGSIVADPHWLPVLLDSTITGIGVLTLDGGSVYDFDVGGFFDLRQANSHTGETVITGHANVIVRHPGAFGSPAAGTRISRAIVTLNQSVGHEPFLVQDRGALVLAPSAVPYTESITLQRGGQLGSSGDGTMTLSTPLRLDGGGGTLGSGLTIGANVEGVGTLKVGVGGSSNHRFRGSLTNFGDVILSGTASFDGPFLMDGDLYVLGGQGTVESQHGLSGQDVVLIGGLAIHANNSVGQLVVGSAAGRSEFRPNLSIAPGATLTITDQLRFLGGSLQGAILGQPTLLKTSPDTGTISSLTGSAIEHIQVQDGELIVAGSLGASRPDIRLVSPDRARVRFEGAPSIEAVVYLDNSMPRHLDGALSTARGTTLVGDVYLGDIGANIGNGDITGRIHGGALNFRGSHELILRGRNHSYTGPTSITGRSLTLTDDGGLLSTSRIVGTGRFGPNDPNGTIVLDNRASIASNNRIGDSIPLDFGGTTLSLMGRENTSIREQIGDLMLSAGHNVLHVENLSPDDQTTELVVRSLQRQVGASVQFQNSRPGSRILLDAPVSLNDGLIGGWATIGDANTFDFVTVGPEGFVPYASQFAYATDLNAALATDAAEVVNSSVVITMDRQVNALRMQGSHIDLAEHHLDVESGGIIVSAGTVRSSVIAGGQLTGGTTQDGELMVHAGYSALTIESDIVDSSRGPLALTSTGAGGVILSGRNTYSGPTTVNFGSSIKLATPTALPDDTDLMLNGGRIEVGFGSLTSMNLRKFVLQNSGRIHPGSNLQGAIAVPPNINADSYQLEAGNIGLPLIGSGTITKTTPGLVSITASPNYTGKVLVEDGTIFLNDNQDFGSAPLDDAHAIVIGSRGSINARGNSTSNRKWLLNGGSLVGQGSFQTSTPITINGSARLASEGSPWTVNARMRGMGELTLESPLVSSNEPWLVQAGSLNEFSGNLQTRGGHIQIRGNNRNYRGRIDVRSQSLVPLNSPWALGTGPVVVWPDANLQISQPLSADVHLNGGGLRFWGTQGLLTGTLTVHDESFLYLAFPFDFTEFHSEGTILAEVNMPGTSHLRLAPDVVESSTRQTVSVPMDLTLASTINVGSDARITSYEADLHLTGLIAANDPHARLHITHANRLEFHAGIHVPQGTSLEFLANDLLVPLEIYQERMVSGSGRLANSVLINDGGSISPGDSAGILTVDGNVTMGSAGGLQIEIGGNAPGTGYDVLDVGGTIHLAGFLAVDLLDSFRPAPGDRFSIVSAQQVTGRFANADQPLMVGDSEFLVVYGDRDVTLVALPIPEPSTASLVLVCLVIRWGCLDRRRRRLLP